MTLSTLLAEGEAQPSAFNPMMLVLLLLVAVMIFMMFRNKKKMAAQQEENKTRMVPGAEVMTTAGIFGTIVAVDPEAERVELQVAPGQVMTFHVRAISQFVTPKDEVAGDSNEPGTDAQRD